MNRIQNFPISFFSVILGLAGLTIASQKIEGLLTKSNFHVSNYILGFTLISFIIISFLYFFKFIYYKQDISTEFNNPVKLSFFPTFSISFLLLSIAFIPLSEVISKHLWEVGVIIQFIFTLKIISIWIQHKEIEIKYINPAWFIPAVGNIIVPIGGLLYYSSEISWFFFSFGLILWTILQTIVFYRIIFHHPLPNKLVPTLFILIAPPAIGFISYVKLVGEIDPFARILYYFAFFLVILLLFQIKFFKRLEFFLSWWAYSFPISAFTIASILMYHQTDLIFFKYVSFFSFASLVGIIVFLILKTVSLINKKGICIPDE